MTLAQAVSRGTRSRALDLAAIRRDNPLPAIVGAVVKLQSRGAEWKACCPLHNDRTPSFTIYSGGERFYCFGCGAGGDVLDFVQRLHNVDLRAAAEMLGGGNLPVAEFAKLEVERVDCDRTAEALAMWEAAEPVEGTVAETYLHWRGITMPAPLSLRYAELPFGTRGQAYQCLVACVSGPEGPLSGIQRTYLAPDGRGKADVPTPRLSLGRVRGGAIRLGPVAADIIVAEGIEDAATLQQELGVTAWAAAGSSNLAGMRFPPIVRRVTIAGDNDDAGRAAAHQAAEAIALRGIETRVMFPLSGAKDFNQELMEGGRA